MSKLSLSEKVIHLKQHGVAYKQIAEQAGCNISTIYRIRDQLITDPSYSIGKTIDDLVSGLSEPQQAA